MLEWVLIASAVTAVSTYVVMALERRKGLVAPDVHKPGRPAVPKTAGPAYMVTALFGLLLATLNNVPHVPHHMMAALIAGFLGLYDDFRGINAFWKVVLLTAPALPVILSSSYIPRPYVPLVGQLRLHIIYPLLLLLAYTVSINAYNMIDTHNGVAVGVALASSAAMTVSSVLGWGPPPMNGGLHFALFVTSFLISYIAFNTYPAKIFNGNSGSFILGALVASEAVLLRREYLLIMLSTPLIINGFSLITSVSGLRNKEEIVRPVELAEDMRMRPSMDARAPVTLVQLLVLKEPMTERELVRTYYILILVNTVLSLSIYYVLVGY
ncbi:MAG: hypothetical protein QW705_05130 [Zestosphaera sp.]